MTDREDDDAALRWEGDEELGRQTSLDRPSPARARVAGEGASVADAPVASAAGPPRDRVLALVSALFAILYLAATVCWILVIQRIGSAFATGTGILDFLGGMSRFLALLAAPLWFVSTLRLTTRREVRIGWFALGLGVLIPWPLVAGLVL